MTAICPLVRQRVETGTGEDKLVLHNEFQSCSRTLIKTKTIKKVQMKQKKKQTNSHIFFWTLASAESTFSMAASNRY